MLEQFARLGLIEPVGAMLQRLRRDLGLNLVGAAMVLEMAQEIVQLKAQLNAYRQATVTPPNWPKQ